MTLLRRRYRPSSLPALRRRVERLERSGTLVLRCMMLVGRSLDGSFARAETQTISFPLAPEVEAVRHVFQTPTKVLGVALEGARAAALGRVCLGTYIVHDGARPTRRWEGQPPAVESGTHFVAWILWDLLPF